MIVPESSTPLSLLDGVRRREEAAWDRLLFLYAPLVEHWCRNWGAFGPDADDIRQEVFQAVAAGLDGFRRERPGDTFRGWLRVIAKRKFFDFCRRKQGQPEAKGGSDAHHQLLQVPDPDGSTNDAGSIADLPEEVTRLHHRALELIRSQFEERTWRAFWRCVVDARSPIEVAEEMQMTPAAVRKAKSRVLRRLKTELGELLG